MSMFTLVISCLTTSKPTFSLSSFTSIRGFLVPLHFLPYASTRNAEEAEVERFYEDLQDLVELTPKKDVIFIIGDWNAKVGSQETPGVTGKFGVGVRNEAGQR